MALEAGGFATGVSLLGRLPNCRITRASTMWRKIAKAVASVRQTGCPNSGREVDGPIVS